MVKTLENSGKVLTAIFIYEGSLNLVSLVKIISIHTLHVQMPIHKIMTKTMPKLVD